MEKISTKVLIDDVANSVMVLKKVVKTVIDEMIKQIVVHGSSGVQVGLTGLGTFKPVIRAERKGRNPKTGIEVHIPERRALAFKAATGLNDL